MSGEMRVRAAVLRAIGGPLTVEELTLSPPRAEISPVSSAADCGESRSGAGGATSSHTRRS